MTTLLLLMLVIAAIGCVLSFYYSTNVQPLLIDWVRSRICEYQEQLKSLPRSNEFAFDFLHTLLMAQESSAGGYSMAALLEFSREHQDEDVDKDIEKKSARFLSEASQEYKEIFSRADRTMNIALLGNSMGWFLFGSVLFAYVLLYKKAGSAWLAVTSASFWQSVTLSGPKSPIYC